jgi:hypothetical protein
MSLVPAAKSRARRAWSSPPVLRAGRVVLGTAHVARSTQHSVRGARMDRQCIWLERQVTAQNRRTFPSSGPSARNDSGLPFLEFLGTARMY